MLSKESIISNIQKEKIIAVLVIDRIEDAEPLAEALGEGGVTHLELTLRTPVALEAIEILVKKFPKMTVGAGTVLTIQQLEEVKERGVPFAVSPGFNPKIMAHAEKIGLPFFPGVMTPSDIEGALEFGCTLLKFFPAEPAGGLNYLKSMSAPYAHLGLQFIPLGGVKPANLGEYTASPLIGAVGGSWLAPRELITAKNWNQIRQNAEEATSIIQATLEEK